MRTPSENSPDVYSFAAARKSQSRTREVRPPTPAHQDLLSLNPASGHFRAGPPPGTGTVLAWPPPI
jgi:hypothetical protein